MNNDYRINEHILDINHEKSKIIGNKRAAEKLMAASIGNKIDNSAYHQKMINRRDFLRGTVLGMASIAAALYLNEKIGLTQKIGNELDLHAANTYMIDNKFKEYFEKLEIPYETEEFLMFKKLNINDDNIDIMRALLEYLQDDGFTETEAWFAISQAFGNDGLHLVAKVYDKKNIDELLLSSGYLFVREDKTQAPYREYFANQNQPGYIENVKRLKELDLEAKKGKGL